MNQPLTEQIFMVDTNLFSSSQNGFIWSTTVKALFGILSERWANQEINAHRWKRTMERRWATQATIWSKYTGKEGAGTVGKDQPEMAEKLQNPPCWEQEREGKEGGRYGTGEQRWPPSPPVILRLRHPHSMEGSSLLTRTQKVHRLLPHVKNWRTITNNIFLFAFILFKNYFSFTEGIFSYYEGPLYFYLMIPTWIVFFLNFSCLFFFSPQAISFLLFSPSPILHVPTTPSLLPFCDFWHYFSSLCFYLVGDLLQSHLRASEAWCFGCIFFLLEFSVRLLPPKKPQQ